MDRQKSRRMDTAVRLDGAGRGRARRWAVRVVRVVLAIVLGLMAVLYVFQTRLIFPGAGTQGRADAVFETPPGAELVPLTTAGGHRIVALYGPALTPDGR